MIMMGHHAKVDHDSIDEMMTGIAQASESLQVDPLTAPPSGA